MYAVDAPTAREWTILVAMLVVNANATSMDVAMAIRVRVVLGGRECGSLFPLIASPNPDAGAAGNS